MYYCNNCKAQFEEARILYESHGEEFKICPMCGDEDIEEGDNCPICHGFKPTSKDLCVDCEENLEVDTAAFIKQVERDYGISYKDAKEYITMILEA